MAPTKASEQKRRHHYVPSTYLRGFLQPDGRLFAYKTDTPSQPLHVQPENVGFQNYYYSFLKECGARDDVTFEDFFGEIEDHWRGSLAAIRDRAETVIDHGWMFRMMGIMRTRGPASRDADATLKAAKLRVETQLLHRHGKLSEELQRYADELDTVPIGINPHQTLNKIRANMMDMAGLVNSIGYEIIHNRTPVDFITSDNPVAYYAAVDDDARIAPYSQGDRVELLFPLDARTLLRGATRLGRPGFVSRHRNLTREATVQRFNRIAARFAYRWAFATTRGHERVVQRFATTSAVIQYHLEDADTRDVKIVYDHVFGARPALSKFIDTPEKAEALERKMAAARKARLE